jgi:hypothetical protein
VLSRLLGQRSLSVNTLTIPDNTTKAPTKTVPMSIPSKVIDVGTSMTPPGSPTKAKRVRYMSVGDEDIPKKVMGTPEMLKVLSYFRKVSNSFKAIKVF